MTMADSEDLKALEAQAAAARGALIEARARREEAKRAAKLREEIAEAEQEEKNLEILDALEAEHGALDKDIARVNTPGGMVVLKHNGTHFRAFQHKTKDRVNIEATQDLVRVCAIHPDKESFSKLLNRYPGALAMCAEALATLAGYRSKDDGGK